MEEAPSLFWSFPNDIVLNVIARVPRKYHTILSCVSKKLRSIVRSPELHKTRSLLAKDCFYICFQELGSPSSTYHWFSLTENRRLVSIPFPSPPEPYSAALVVGSVIYFIGGGYFNHPSRSMWILDSRSGKFRQGPSMLVATRFPAVGVVDDKIYIIGGCKNREIQAQMFDLKTKIWEIALNPSVEVQNIWMSVENHSLDRKIYAKDAKRQFLIVYDPRDGNCKIIKLLDNYPLYYSGEICVIDNVLYTSNYSGHGELMWYNPKEKKWGVVHGLNLNKYDINHWSLSMAEYNGKLALLWHDTKKMEIWCSMIELRRGGVTEVQGRIEWSNCILSDVPPQYKITHCFGRTD